MRNPGLKASATALFTLFLVSGWMADQASAAVAPKCPSNKAKLVVAKIGGDYNTITSALMNSTPTATSPCIIEVLPGIYVESITMKSYVVLQGSGRDVTTLQAAAGAGYVITMHNLSNVTISGLTIKADPNSEYVIDMGDISTVTIKDNKLLGDSRSRGIGADSASQNVMISGNIITNNGKDGMGNPNIAWTITGNSITGNGTSGGYPGIQCGLSNGSVTISGNIVSENTHNGITCLGLGTSTIVGNTVSSNGMAGIFVGAESTVRDNIVTGNNEYGISVFGDSPDVEISNNTVKGNGAGIYAGYTNGTVSGNNVRLNIGTGIVVSGCGTTVTGNTVTSNGYSGGGYGVSASCGMIIHNRVTENGGGTSTDINIPGGTPHISYNVYDSLTGTTAAGKYNLKSDGTVWP